MRRLDSIPKPSLDSIRLSLRPFEATLGYPRGAEFFAEGAPARSVFVLTAGIVRLRRSSADGRHALLGMRTTGAMPGAVDALVGAPYTMTATALTRCEAYRLSGQAFHDLVRNDPAFSWYVHHLQCYENHEALDRIAGLSCLSARERLDAFLESLSDEFNVPPTGGEVPLRDRELAHFIAVTPSYLSRLLRKLADEGRLHRAGGVLYLNEPVASVR
jgi:CRP-like cAMP-binding protein